MLKEINELNINKTDQAKFKFLLFIHDNPGCAYSSIKSKLNVNKDTLKNYQSFWLLFNAIQIKDESRGDRKSKNHYITDTGRDILFSAGLISRPSASTSKRSEVIEPYHDSENKGVVPGSLRGTIKIPSNIVEIVELGVNVLESAFNTNLIRKNIKYPDRYLFQLRGLKVRINGTEDYTPTIKQLEQERVLIQLYDLLRAEEHALKGIPEYDQVYSEIKRLLKK